MSQPTPETLRQLDTESRALAQREFRTPIVLEAGAGTGKTATLVARVIAWCVGPGWERAQAQCAAGASGLPCDERVAERTLSRVVAVTFTEAAAAEMASRVDGALRELEAGALPIGVDADALPAPALRRTRATALRGALDHLVVQTIHAYCRRLLAAHPFDAGVHPRLEIDANGRERAAQVRDAVERRLREAYAAPGDSAALRLAAHGIGPLEIEREANALLEQGADAALLEREPFAPEALAAAHARLRAAFDAVRAVAGERLQALSGVPLARAVADALARSEPLLREPPPDAPALERRVAELASLWDASSLGRLRDWGKEKFGVKERAALEPDTQALAAACATLHAALSHWVGLDVPRYTALCEVLAGVLADVDAALARRGVIGFSKLLSQAAALVREDAQVARRVRRQIDQLLVDEFQDTDRRQCEIVAALALEGPPEERPGLFLVGDPKQSIYGWRSADLSAYEAFVARVRDAGGAAHPLAVNFRSLPPILDEVERVIAPVMQREPGLQPAFTPLLPCAALAAAPAPRLAAVEHWVSLALEDGAPRQTTSAAATALEARALAADLRRLHDEEAIAWSDIAVLFRSRGDWDVYLGALREADVPFAVEGDRSHYRRREIIDAAALVRCVLDPSDHLALLAVLRSSAVGVPDAALLPLWRLGLPSLLSSHCAPDAQREQALRQLLEQVAEDLPADVPGLARVRGWEHNLLHAAGALAALRECFARDPADVFVERLRSALLLEASEAARFLGSWRVANLERFFRLLAEELAGGADTQAVLRRLRSAVAEEEPAEEGQPRDLAPDAVRVLTLHGAKGLDFACVYLMQLHKDAGGRDASTSELREHDGEVELCLAGAPSLGFDRALRARDRVAEAERVRTLYVGMTRARVRLVLAGLWPEFQRSGGARSHASLLPSRRDAPPDLRALFDACVREGASGVDAHGARWVFPALAAPVAVSPSRASDAQPRRARMRRDAQQLRDARALAEARMLRPLSDTASSQEEAAADAGHGAPPQVSPGACVAQLVGSAVHRSLEHFDFGAGPEAELARAHAALADALRALAPPQHLDAALREARARLDALAGGQLLARLRALREHIVARELPVLLAPGPGDRAVALLSGAIDLVYRDPDTGELVIVDYTTDRVADAAALEARTRRYAQQGAVYQRALRTALGLAAPPRFELWYLSADRRIDATDLCAQIAAQRARG